MAIKFKQGAGGTASVLNANVAAADIGTDGSVALKNTPTAPTAAVGTSTTQLATTAFVNAEIANDTYLKGTLDTSTTIMSKAAFNALAAERRANRAGSGFDEWGKHEVSGGNVNEGMWTYPTWVNYLKLGRLSGAGVSKTEYPVVAINGVNVKVSYLNSTGIDTVPLLPPAPTVLPYDAVLTPEQIAMGVIKHADSSNSGLIVNGKFTTDTSGWTGYRAGYPAPTISWNPSGKLDFSISSLHSAVEYVLTVVPNKKYIFECNCTVGVYISSYDGAVVTGSDVTSTYNKIEFSTTQSTIRLWLRGVNTGTTYTVDNIAVFPADAISRSDLVFLESWHEDVSEKDFVYPLGNVQYLGTTGNAGTTVAGAFAGSATYSLFSDTWQADGALVGKGYVWSTLSDADKKAFVANPENNCYLDGDKVIQVRYRMRVVAGWGDSWSNVDPNINATGLSAALKYGTAYVLAKGKQPEEADVKSALSTGTDFFYSGNAQYGYKSINGVFDAVESSGAIPSNTLAYEGKCFALPIALVHRRNQGAYHPVYNSNGTAASWQSKVSSTPYYWWESTVGYASIADTFTYYSTSSTWNGAIPTSGHKMRPDELAFDQVHESDILDLRMSSAKVEDYNRLIDREFSKLVAGAYRGSEGEWTTVFAGDTTSTGNSYLSRLGAYSTRVDYTGNPCNFPTNATLFAEADRKGTYIKGSDGNYYRAIEINISSSNNMAVYLGHEYGDVRAVFAAGVHNLVVSNKATRTKSNTLTHCDIIGSPANYPTSWKQSGVSGVPLIVAENGTSMLPTGALTAFKLSRKANATPLQVLKSTDSGATWNLQAVTTNYTFSTVTNAITFVVAPAATDLIMVTYQTHTSMVVPGVNSEVLAIGDVLGLSDPTLPYCQLPSTLLGKVATSTVIPAVKQGYKINGNFVLVSTKFYATSEWFPQHDHFSLGADSSPAVKTFPYLTRSNGKAILQLVFKEMKYSSANADWGDDTKFDIVDNVSTTTDFYGNTVLIGQKYAELPYFIEAKE